MTEATLADFDKCLRAMGHTMLLFFSGHNGHNKLQCGVFLLLGNNARKRGLHLFATRLLVFI